MTTWNPYTAGCSCVPCRLNKCKIQSFSFHRVIPMIVGPFVSLYFIFPIWIPRVACTLMNHCVMPPTMDCEISCKKRGERWCHTTMPILRKPTNGRGTKKLYQRVAIHRHDGTVTTDWRHRGSHYIDDDHHHNNNDDKGKPFFAMYNTCRWYCS